MNTVSLIYKSILRIKVILLGEAVRKPIRIVNS